MTNMLSVERDLNLNLMKETELCLGLPGGGGGCKSEQETPRATTGKRGFSETVDLELNFQAKEKDLNDKINNATKEKNLLPCTKDPAKPPAK